jgi:hypothetical protein
MPSDTSAAIPFPAADVSAHSSTGSTMASAGSANVLAAMLTTPWGTTAATSAIDLGVNPVALAATCMLASGCSTPSGGSAARGVFQLHPDSFQQGLREALAIDPSLTSQIVQGHGAISDPTTAAIAASGYLILVAQTLQNAGISHPTILQARCYFIFGAANVGKLATASPGTLMSEAMPSVSQATLTANGVAPGETVAEWETSITARIGAAATQSLLAR